MTEEHITKIVDAFVALLPYLTGAIIGAFGGIVSARYSHKLKAANESSAVRRDKLEELLTEVKEITVWLNSIKEWRLFGQQRPNQWSPQVRVNTLVSLYFPEMHSELHQLDSGIRTYWDWLNKIREAQAKGDSGGANLQKLKDDEDDYYRPYAESSRAFEYKVQEVMQTLL